ncbi:fimbria/pilus periplasmic chaperone [Providencia burhodogranariea]|uniref:Fimbrial chaperone protein FimC n=1 Tax=Providencia burhodogranariea DSM 19968 TaxID=1141662 RepID=K8X1D8_9GAMM|nr:fimbrial chaperone protein FimC [Providencia burhodogranariea DSM 19968]
MSKLISLIKKIYFLMPVIAFVMPTVSVAGGIALGATRIIYPLEAKQISLAINNTDEKNRFLIQSWVDDSSDKKTKDFIITPPLFVSKPKSENTIRIINAGANLPKDRESLFWLNSKAIPSIDRTEIEDKNVLQIAVLARVKIFVRPEGLTMKSGEAYKMLKFNRVNDELNIDNPTPYYLTIINMKIGNNEVASTMVSPLSNKRIKLPRGTMGRLSYQTINDYGANTPLIETNLN